MDNLTQEAAVATASVAATDSAPIIDPPIADAPADAAPTEDMTSDLRSVWAKNNKPRDEAGRFAQRQPETGKPATEAPEAVADEATAEAADEAPKPATPAIDAPRAWKAEAKAHWSKVPPELQSVIAASEQENQNLRSQVGRFEAEYRPLREAMKPYEGYLKEVSGGNVAGYVQRLLAASHALDTNPAETIKALANTYGVDLGQIYDPLETPPDPRVAQLERQLAAYQGHFEQMQQARAASEEAARTATANEAVDAFYRDHPDANDIPEAEFAAQIQVIKAMEPDLDYAAALKKAYERAVWSSDGLRQKRLEAIQRDAEAKRIAAAKEAASKARSAASVNVTGAVAGRAAPDMDADLRSIWRKNNAA